MNRSLAVLCLMLGVALPAAAHGPSLGKVHFQVECNADAQREFNVAMAYYHSFASRRCRRRSSACCRLIRKCGMAHWLRTLAASTIPFCLAHASLCRDLSEGGKIRIPPANAGLKSQRERDYVDALAVFFKDQDKLGHPARAKALETALEQVMRAYPQDTEAATLYALVLSANFDPADKKYTNQLKAAKILEPIFKAQPQHPGVAHYLIHSYDYPPIAAQGLDAARRYGKIAPDAPHALHMPSHIFTRVGAWKDSIESNRASARSGGDKSFDKWHAYDYMVSPTCSLRSMTQRAEIVGEAQRNPARIDHRRPPMLRRDAGAAGARAGRLE